MDRVYCVYMHIFPNNKKYIGITCQKPEYRWRHDGSGYKPRKNQNSSKMWNAIQKYGWENILHKILYANLSKEEACNKEIELIAYYNTMNSDFGYNIAFGGDIHAISDDTKERISKSKKGKNYGMIGENAPMYGKHHSVETKNKISISVSGENNPFYGKHHTEESKMKDIESHLYESKAVEQYDKSDNLIGLYFSIHEASRKTGVNRSCIQAALRGNQKTAGGYVWKYADTTSFSVFEQLR